MEIPTKIKNLMQQLLDNNFEAYIIGGACRDYLRGVEPKDFDLFTNAEGKEILKIFPNGKVLGNEDRQKKILTVIVDGVEISQYRSNGARTELGTDFETHLNTCDFRLNSIACNIKGELFNSIMGQYDIEVGKIHAVGNALDRIKEDPLRIFRALRFSFTLGYKLDIILEQECINNISLLDNIAKDRIRTELIKILKAKHLDINNRLFRELILYISPIFRELDTLGCGKFHDETPFEHSLYALEIAHKYTSDYRLLLSALFHDIGKKEAHEIIDGNDTFYQHHKFGSEIAKQLLTEYNFSNDDIKYISTMIRHHMMGYNGVLSNKALIKIVADLESNGIDIEDMVLMIYSDNQGNKAKDRVKFNDFYKEFYLLKRVYKLKYERMPFRITDLEITGKDVLALGLNGKDIGIMLNTIFNEVVEAKLKNDRHTLLYRLKELCD